MLRKSDYFEITTNKTKYLTLKNYLLQSGNLQATKTSSQYSYS